MLLAIVFAVSLLLIGGLLWCLRIVSLTHLDLYESGLVALGKQDYSKARNLFLSALAKHTEFVEAKYNLGLSYLGLEEYEEAKEYFQAVLAEIPNDFHSLFNLALVCQLDEEYDEALELYQKAILADPQDVDCFLNIAVIYFEKQEYQKSLEFLNMAKEIAPNKIEILYTIARCKDEMCTYEKDEEVDAVLAEYEALLERTDLPSDFNMSLAKVYAKAGRVINALERCSIVIEEDYFNDEAHRLLGLLLIIRNDFENARRSIQRAVDVEPDDPENYNLLAYTYFGQKNEEDFKKMKAKYKNILLASGAK